MAEQDEMVQGSDARVYTTAPNNPDEGRTFVWAKARWYEREEGETGAVAFPPVADSFTDLYQSVQQEPGADLSEIDDDFAAMVREEFMAQDQLYPYVQDSERVDEVVPASQLDSDDRGDEVEGMSGLHLEDSAGAEMRLDDLGTDELEMSEMTAEGAMGSGAFDDEQLESLESTDRPRHFDLDESAPIGRGRSAADPARMEQAPADVRTPDQGDGLGDAAGEADGPRTPVASEGVQSVRGGSPADLAAAEGTEPPPPGRGQLPPRRASNEAEGRAEKRKRIGDR